MEQEFQTPNDSFGQYILNSILDTIIDEEIFRMERFLNEIEE